MKNKNLGFLLVGVLLLCLVLFLGAEKAPAVVKVEGFVYDSCGGCFSDSIPCKPCKVVLGLEEYLFSELDRLGVGNDVKVEVHNTLYDEQKERLSERLSEDQLGELKYPVICLEDTVLYGWEQIEKDFASTVAAKKEITGAAGASEEEEIQLEKAKSSTIVYFKMKSCRSCQKTEAYLDELSKRRDDYELLAYDIEDQGNLALFQAYCGKYGLDAENTFVPAVFIGDRCLEGFEEAELFLKAYLEAGYAKDTYRVK